VKGVGVHLRTGPVAIENAEPGDILEVRILDVRPRPSCHASCRALFRLQRRGELGFSLSRPDRGAENRRSITIFELGTSGEPFARAVYNYV